MDDGDAFHAEMETDEGVTVGKIIMAFFMLPAAVFMAGFMALMAFGFFVAPFIMIGTIIYRLWIGESWR